MTALARLAVWLGLRAVPVPAAPAPVVHRGEREISAGPAALGAPDLVPAKLAPDDAERLLGVPVRILR